MLEPPFAWGEQLPRLPAARVALREIGFALARAHWGLGLMAEALARLISFSFEHLGLARLEADVDPRNTRSIACLERQGFRREGYLRQRYRVAGDVQDAVLFGLLRDEWYQTRSV